MKGTIVINPQTSRPIKVGGRIWLKLVREGLLVGECKDDNEIYTIQEGDDVDEKIKELDKSLPPNVHSVRGRGKYANKIVKRHKQPSTAETSRYTVKTTARKLKNREVYEDLQESGNFEDELEALIMGELANLNTEGGTFEQSESPFDNYEYDEDDYEDEQEVYEQSGTFEQNESDEDDYEQSETEDYETNESE